MRCGILTYDPWIWLKGTSMASTASCSRSLCSGKWLLSVWIVSLCRALVGEYDLQHRHIRQVWAEGTSMGTDTVPGFLHNHPWHDDDDGSSNTGDDDHDHVGDQPGQDQHLVAEPGGDSQADVCHQQDQEPHLVSILVDNWKDQVWGHQQDHVDHHADHGEDEDTSKQNKTQEV